MTSKTALSLIFLFILPCRLGYAEHTRVIQTDEVVVVFEQSLRGVARDVVARYPAIKAELENILNWSVDFRPTVALTVDRQQFEKITGSRFVVAYAVPHRNLLVIDYSRMDRDLAAMMKHELCHLVLHNKIKDGELPRWLDEGVCQWVSDGIAEILMSRKGAVLETAVLSKRLIHLRALERHFPEDEKSLLLAYEESKSIVEFIDHQFGRDGILELLGYLQDGHQLDEAVVKSLSMPFAELQRRWQSHLREKITWFTYLAKNMYGLLFFLGALITIAGFVRVVLKKRRYGEDESSI
jgi:hypothetical protein